MRVSVVIPYIRETWQKCALAVASNAGIPESDLEIIAVEDAERIGCPKMVKKLVAICQSQLICFLGDDCEPQENFLVEALKEMEKLPDGWGLIGFNDGIHHGTATHWIADRRLLNLTDGEFFHTGYKHCFCDDELRERAEYAGRYAWAVSARIKHNNPLAQGVFPYDKEQYRADGELFKQRTKMWRKSSFGKVAYATRLHRYDPAFFVSWSKLLLDKPDGDIALTPAVRLPHACACNFLLNQFMASDADSILFIDDDMVFTSEDLERLRFSAGDYGVVSGLCCSSMYPHQPLVLVKPPDGGRAVVKDGFYGVTQVDFTGMAFTLIKKQVIRDIQKTLGTTDIFEWTNEFGEDGNFCNHARSLGYKIAVNTNVTIGHAVRMSVKWNTATRSINLGCQNFIE